MNGVNCPRSIPLRSSRSVLNVSNVGPILGDSGAASRDNRTGKTLGHLLFPNQFQKLSNSLLLIGHKEEQPGDSDLFFHEVVFLIDRYSCIARSMRKVSRPAPLLTNLSSTQRQAYLLHLYVRRTTSKTFYCVKIFVAQATQLCRLNVGNAGWLQRTHLLAFVPKLS